VNQWRQGSKPVIGLIGGIGAGKTTAARGFQMRNGAVIDADVIGHRTLEQPNIIEKVTQRWGDSVRKANGSLDRRAIGRIVFANPKERNALEEMVFPFIGKECKKEIKKALDDPDIRFAVLDAAVLLEAGWNENVDRIVYIEAPREIRLARVAERNGWSEADLTAREAAQWPAEMKKAKSDVILINEASSEDLQRQIDQLLEEWQLL
jgi:dephospho-CoA kinase